MPAKSKQQQRFMGMVHAIQKGEKVKGASKELRHAARSISKKDAKDYASTKHDEIPTKKESFSKYYESRTYYSDTLHPSFWDGEVFADDIRMAILKIVADFLKEDENISEDIIEDIQLTGSLANYNYSEKSDLDVHILLDFADINDDEDLVKRALDGKRFIWNLKHNIKLNGHEVELYFQDIHEPHTASGLFSLQDNKWIKKPVHDKPEVDHRDVIRKSEEFKKEIRSLKNIISELGDEKELQLVNKRAKSLKQRIMKMRKEGLSSKGEFSVENLAFKNLRDNDYIAKLNDIIINSYDHMFNKEILGEKDLSTWLKERWCNR